MNYCVYLKKRKNKPFCKLVNEEISFSRCRECVNKEYHLPDARKMVTNYHQLKKYTKFSKNSARIYSNNYKMHNKSAKMKNKSNKLAKLERNRFSVFCNNNECIVCKSTYQLTWHEIFAGRNRRNSMEDGFCLRLCLNCHEEKQEDIYFNDFWHKKAQMYYEEFIGSREDFLARYRRNYLN